jgi:hypothetical protein
MGGNPTHEEFGKFFPSLQFVVLYHQFPPGSVRESHWDLLLEQPQPESHLLLTFEVSTPPRDWGKPTSAKRLPDHRSIYLSYVGPVSGNRGTVSQALQGDAQWVSRTESLLVLNLRFHWASKLQNPTVQAVLCLTRTAAENERDWELKLQVCGQE